MKKLILLALLVSLNAQASIYEDLKSKFEGRPAAKLSQLKNLPMKCAVWHPYQGGDEGYQTHLVRKTFTFPANGPAYPARTVSLPLMEGILWDDDAEAKSYVEAYQIEELVDRVRLSTNRRPVVYYTVDFKFDQYLYFEAKRYNYSFRYDTYGLLRLFGYCWND